MPSLSIVIPVVGDTSRLETTLVSVLSHRPANCEIVVVLAVSYDDPYELADEVRFVAARPRASWVECVNLGIQESDAEVVHIVESGLEVEEGWTDAALRHFDDPRLAAVAPVVFDAGDTTRVLAAGVEYRTGGRRVTLLADGGKREVERWRHGLRAPHRLAGFYRRAMLVDIVGDFDEDAGDFWADAEMAVRLRHAGFAAVLEPASRLSATAEVACDAIVSQSGSLRSGYQAERTFWRNLPARGALRSLPSHFFSVLGETLRALPSMAVLGLVVGRLLGLTAIVSQSGYRARLRELGDVAAEGATLPVAEHLDRRAALRGEQRARSVASDALRHSA